MAEVEMIGVPDKQAFTVSQGTITKAYQRMDVRSKLYTDGGERVVADVQAVREESASASMSTATTTTHVTGPGYLRSITILGGTMGTIDVYDNTAGSGTKLLPTFTPPASCFQTIHFGNIPFAIGLTIVTGAATVLQVSYH